MATSTNSFLRNQRKTQLLELAEAVGLDNTEGLKKSSLELALDEYLSENPNHSINPKAAPFYQSRSKATGTPFKKDLTTTEPRRRRAVTKQIEQAAHQSADDDSEPAASATPANRALTHGQQMSLPSSPGELARVVDERTLAVRERVSALYVESGIKDITYETRAALSTVSSIIFAINSFELYYLRKEILADTWWFTIPAIKGLGTSDYPVMLPDVLLLLHSSFWSPLFLWLLTSVIVPMVFGFYFNLSAAHSPDHRRSSRTVPRVDPLTFSIAKAVVTYVVYQQGASFDGWVSQESVARINSAVYGGWKGLLTGAFISGVFSFYDAVLSR